MFFRLRAISIVAVITVGILSPFAAHAQQPTEQRAVVEQQNTDSSLVQLSIPIGGKNSVSGLPEYIVTWYQYALGIVTIVGIIMLIVGGFKYLLSASIPEVSNGKKIIQDVIGGTVILFLAYVILYNINPKTVNLSLPTITSIREVVIPGSQNASTGTSCSKDTDCQAGAKCLRTSLVGGLCADGRSGNICECEGQGCTVTADQAGGPVNNAGEGRITCQPGLQCQHISDGHSVCNGGTGSACNETTTETLEPMQTRAGEAVAAGLDPVTGLMSSVLGAPFSLIVAGADYALNSENTRDVTQTFRAAVHCTAPQFCFQPSRNIAGGCVYGDSRDTAMFQNIPSNARNEGLLETVTQCGLTEAQIRALPRSRGGCRNNNTDGGVDDFCIAHRYHCSSTATCSQTEYSRLFAGTLRAYHSWERVPPQMKPEYYVRQGCLKPVGGSCTQDTECPSKCINGRCSGFSVIEMRTEVTPGSVSGLPNATEVRSTATDGPGCDNSHWTGTDLFDQALTSGDRDAQDRALEILFQAGTPDRFACYPVRPAGAHCDFNKQCHQPGGTCSAPTPTSLPPTFSHPMDNGAGVGTCS